MKGETSDASSEHDFAARVEAIVRDAAAHDCTDAPAVVSARTQLVELLREDHAVYAERSAAAIIRMRGWILLALEKVGVRDPELPFVFEELDNGRDPYLVAAAARALRSYPTPVFDFVSTIDQAIENIRYHDDSLNLEQYGGYGTDDRVTTTAVGELERTRRWLKKNAVVDQSAAGQQSTAASGHHGCCSSFQTGESRPSVSCDAAVFEDHDGRRLAFADFFHGKPSIAAFFYTRCNNPLKCSLTIAKLAQVQQVMMERGLSERIRIAAITYDPEYDVPERLRRYAHNRGMRLNDEHRMLRATEHWDAVRQYFALGVNFVGSIVNRHRIEVSVLDGQGKIAASFARLRWNERDLVARAEALLPRNPDRQDPQGSPPPTASSGGASRAGASVTCASFGTIATLGAAFFPKCAMCWTTYVSALGVTGLEQIPYAPWLLPVFIGLIVMNLVTLWPGRRSQPGLAAFTLAALGAIVIVWLSIGLQLPFAAPLGVALTVAGSILSVRSRVMRRRQTVVPVACFR